MAKRKCGVVRAMRRLSSFLAKELPFFYSLPAVVWQFFFMVAPALIIIGLSFTDATVWWRISLVQYQHLIASPYFKIIGRSLLLAISTAITGLVCAYPVAYFLVFRARRFKHIMLFLLTLPFWVNFLVQIYAWYFLLERNGLINALLLRLGIITEPLLLSTSLFAVFLVMVYCYLPFVIMPLYSTLEKINPSLLEASSDLGATPWQTFSRVTVPLSMPGIKTGLLLVLIPAFGEFVIPALIGGSKYMLVGSLISYYFLVARNDSAGAAFTCLSALMLLIVLAIFYASSRMYRMFRAPDGGR